VSINIESLTANEDGNGEIMVSSNSILFLSVKTLNIGAVYGELMDYDGSIQIISGSGSIGAVYIDTFNITLLPRAVFSLEAFEVSNFILNSGGAPNNTGRIIFSSPIYSQVDSFKINIGRVSAPSNKVSLSVGDLILEGPGPKIIDTITIYAKSINFTNGATEKDLTFLNGRKLLKNSPLLVD